MATRHGRNPQTETVSHQTPLAPGDQRPSIRFDSQSGRVGNPSRAFSESIGTRLRLDQHLFAPDSQFRAGYELATVAGAAKETLPRLQLQREARHYPNITSGHRRS